MSKRVSKTVKSKVNGIVIDNVLFYYDKPNDFLEAWPGFKLWLEVRKNGSK